jgi:hypothetical protein
MTVLTDAQRRYVVRSLARFNSLTQTVRALQAEHGVTVTKAAIAKYKFDPAAPDEAGVCLTTALRKLFLAERKRYIEDLEAQPMAHKSVRLGRINQLYEEAVDANNPKMAARALGLAITETKQVTAADGSGDGDGQADNELWEVLIRRQRGEA